MIATQAQIELAVHELTGGGTAKEGDLLVRGAERWRLVRLNDAYTIANDSTLRSIDPTTATVGDVANVLATLLRDLQSLGVAK